MRNPGAGFRPIPVNGSESCKKHDKQLTFIVRVMVSDLFHLGIKSAVLE